MTEKDLSLTLLFDIYGELLSETEREDFESYYCDDLSLSEIAENTGRSRQGARDNIVRAEKALRGFEEKLGLQKKLGDIEMTLDSVKTALEKNDISHAKELIDSIKL